MTTKLILVVIGLTSVSALSVPALAAKITSLDIQDETIQSVDIKNGEVKTADLANDAVTTAKIKDGEVTTADIKDATIQSEDIASGVIPSSSGVGHIDAQRKEATVSFPIGEPLKLGVAYCDSGYIASGGGYIDLSPPTDPHIIAHSSAGAFSSDSSIVNGWFVEGENTDPSEPAAMKVSVYCLKIVP